MIRTLIKKTDYKPLELMQGTDGVYIVRWDPVEDKNYDPETKEELPSNYYVCAEDIIYGKPDENFMRKLINKYYNDRTDYKILRTFLFKDQEVWLSEENQRNYKAAYDIAFQTNGANIPVTFKFGTDEAPLYHEFKTVEELSEFYLGAVAHIQACYEEGWRLKDAINYSDYKITD